MTRWRFLTLIEIRAVHEAQLRLFGGGWGTRDLGLLESAMARPENLAAYTEPSVFELAAAYAFGIIKNHPFVDGNKRAGFLAAGIFLAHNGQRIKAAEADAAVMTLEVAAGELTEAQFARWLEENCEPLN